MYFKVLSENNKGGHRKVSIKKDKVQLSLEKLPNKGRKQPRIQET